MNPLSFISTPRGRKFGLLFVLITICTFCLWSSLCGTSDITDNPAQNGGYNRGAIFFLQSPIAVSGKRFAHSLPLVITNPSDIQIPASCRLQTVRVRSLYGKFAVPADNIPRMSAEATFLDGPLQGHTVDITSISTRTYRRLIKLDPAYLQPTPPAAMPTTSPISLPAAMDILRSLPETRAFQKSLDTYRHSIVITQESSPAYEYQFALNEDVSKSLWNRFRINSQSGDITVWVPKDDQWVPLTTWRQSPATNSH